MAKKKEKVVEIQQLLPENPTIEEIEAEQEARRKKRRREEEDPEATPPPVDETPNIPDNPNPEAPEMPTDTNETIIVTGDPENPEIIIIVNPDPEEEPLNSPESNGELTENKEASSG